MGIGSMPVSVLVPPTCSQQRINRTYFFLRQGSGLPAAATRVAGNLEQIADGVTGDLISPGSLGAGWGSPNLAFLVKNGVLGFYGGFRYGKG